MFKNYTLLKSIHKETGTRFYGFEPFHKRYREWVCTKWIIVCLAFTLAFCLAIPAEADMVYGRVYDETGRLQCGEKFTIKGKDPNGNIFSVEVSTDKGDGSYRISIPPGTYKVEFIKNNDTLEAWIQSFPQPIRQDIYLKK